MTRELLNSYKGKIALMLTNALHDGTCISNSEICNSLKWASGCHTIHVVKNNVSICRPLTEMGTSLIGENSRLNELHKKYNELPTQSLDLEKGYFELFSLVLQRDMRKKAQKQAASITNETALFQTVIDNALFNAIVSIDEKKQETLKILQKQKGHVINAIESAAKLDFEYKQIIHNQINNKNGLMDCPNVNVNVADYCGCSEGNGCRGEIDDVLGRWIQDLFYGIEPIKDCPELALGLPTNYKEPDGGAIMSVAGKVVMCQCEEVKRVNHFKLDIDGGNILVADSFVLIGMDDLYCRFLATKKKDVKRRLGHVDSKWSSLTPEQLKNTVTLWLSENLFGGKEIIWVGTDKTRTVYNCSDETACYKKGRDNSVEGRTPFYHIDLFISLLGPNSKCNNEFQYLLGVPDISYQVLPSDPTRKARIIKMVNCLKKHVTDTADKMELEISCKTDIILKRIEVPLLLIAEEKIDTIKAWLYGSHSFVNGLVENTSEGIKYYMPDYKRPSTDCDYLKAKTDIDKIFICNKIDKQDVLMKYPRFSALHCNVKVLKRIEG